MSLYRNAHTGPGSPAMDDLGYWYEVEGGGDRWRAIPGTDDYELASSAGTPLDLAGIGALGLTLRNRLNHVTDAKGVAFTSDLGNQSPDNYAYNAVGELVSDAAEGLEVDWTAYHKVANVHYPSATGTQMQDIDFRYGPMQHRAEKTLRDAGNNLIKTTYYVHDASGNVMAIYEKAFNGGILETRLKELPIYGSDRLGLRLDDTPVKVEALCVYCEAVPNLEPGMLRVSELLYDSPLTPPSSAEVHKGEYVTLRNTSGVPIPLGYVKLRVPSHGSYSFSSTDTLQPDHSILVAYGTGTDSTDLRLADNLPAGLFSDPAMHLRTQTSMTLPDGGGSLQLYEDVSGFETLLENISFGGSGILAANAHCDTTCQADTARPEVQAVQLIDYTDTYTYGGVPYEAREAKGKGKDGETYYTVKAVTGRKPGSKEYELKDHLGNVRVVISDIKHSVIASGVVGSFNADVKVMRDYYAFGMEMPGQIWQAGGYRYGFNGKEIESEIGFSSNYDYGFRWYDARVSKFLSVDPFTSDYPFYSPYQFAGNMPISAVDLDGLEIYFAADGRYLARWGTSSEVRVIDDVNVVQFCSDYYSALMSTESSSKRGIMDFYWKSDVFSRAPSKKDRENIFIEHVIPKSTNEHLCDHENDCFLAMDATLANNNYESVEYWGKGQQVQYQMYAAPGTVSFNMKTRNAGFDVINHELENGRPIHVGVDYAAGGSSNSNTDKTTDHHLLIVGRSVDEIGRLFYTAFENVDGCGQRDGTDPELNRFYPKEDGTLVGATVHGHGFKITQVRTVKKRE